MSEGQAHTRCAPPVLLTINSAFPFPSDARSASHNPLPFRLPPTHNLSLVSPLS